MSLSPREISAIARRICHAQRGAGRLLQIYRPYICPFERLLELVPPGARVLDVGCGGGLFLGLAAATGRLGAGLGFDSNRAAIGIAQRLDTGHDDALSFVHLDVTEPWPDGPFDMVSMIDVMHHVPEDARAAIFELAAGRLEPGGLFLYKDINSRDRVRAFANRMHDLALAQQWVHYLPTEKARTLADAAGLEEILYEKIDRLWYGHDLHVFRRKG